jgi:hypothetical protein
MVAPVLLLMLALTLSTVMQSKVSIKGILQFKQTIAFMDLLFPFSRSSREVHQSARKAGLHALPQGSWCSFSHGAT